MMKLQVKNNLGYNGFEDESNVEAQGIFLIGENAKAAECINTMIAAMILDGYSLDSVIKALGYVYNLYKEETDD